MKKYLKENKKLLINATLSIVIIILILTIILVIYANRETTYDKFSNTLLATIENIKTMELKEDYVLIKFPDKKEIISKNGMIKSYKGKKYEEFKEGYVVVYKDGDYSFKVSNGSYCAYKGYNEESVTIDMEKPCESYEIEYK